MNNYETTLRAAQRHFTEYDMDILAKRAGVTDEGDCLMTSLFGQTVRIDKATGQMLVDGEKANFVQGLSVYDWLCDRNPEAAAAETFCPVSSLPGVLVSGSGLKIVPQKLADTIDKNPDSFRHGCESMGGIPVDQGDIGYRVEIFPGLPVCLKFYFADEEFPPSLTLLWDQNILQFVRYETVYYIAGCLQERLLQLL